VKPFESNNTCDPAKPAPFTKTVMVLPIAAALGEMLVTCGDHIEPQLHSFKKFSEELGKLLRGSLPLWAKSITRMRLHAESRTYTYRHWNITGDAQPLCAALC